MAHNALVPEVIKKTAGRKLLWVIETWKDQKEQMAIEEVCSLEGPEEINAEP